MVLTLVYVFCTGLTADSDFALYNITEWFCITEVEVVYCSVRTESLYATDIFSLSKVNTWLHRSNLTSCTVHTILRRRALFFIY